MHISRGLERWLIKHLYNNLPLLKKVITILVKTMINSSFVRQLRKLRNALRGTYTTSLYTIGECNEILLQL